MHHAQAVEENSWARTSAVSAAVVATLPVMPYRITCVCLGNICRSPIAEAVLRRRLTDAGLGGRVQVDSAGTGDWHVGRPMDRRARAVLDAHGYRHEHVARQIQPGWLTGPARPDLLLAMDEANYDDLAVLTRRVPGATHRLRMLRSFDPSLAGIGEPDPRLAVPDPYYGGLESFDDVLSMIEKAADGLVGGLPTMVQD